MSKKNKKQHSSDTTGAVNQALASHNTEYRIISKDLLRVAILNIAFLVGLLALYYTNKDKQYLEKFFEQIFHF